MATMVLGEFESTAELLKAVRALHHEKRGELDTYSPYPIHGIDEAMGLKRSPVPILAGGAALTGAAVGYLMQWWMNAVDYPINVGNRPLHSPPLNIPITFELAVLITALTIFLGCIGYFFGLPRPHHPVFEVDAFRSASTHAFWVSVVPPAGADPATVADRLKALGAAQVAMVEESK